MSYGKKYIHKKQRKKNEASLGGWGGVVVGGCQILYHI